MKVENLKIPVFKILYLFVFSALFIPAFFRNTSIRLDAVLIYLILPLLLIANGKIRYDRRLRPMVLGFAVFIMLLSASMILQHLFVALPFSLGVWKPILGYLRTFLFLLLTAIALKGDRRKSEMVLQIILIGVIFHSLSGIIEYFRISPMEEWVSFLYNNESARIRPSIAYRAVGAFGYVHALAFFCLYGLIFSITAVRVTQNKSIRNLAKLSVVLSFFTIIISFSRGTYLAGLIAIFYFGQTTFSFPKKVKLLLYFLSSSLILVLLLPERIINDIIMRIRSLGFLVDLVLGQLDQSNAATGYITGRLNHGWANSFNVWLESPLFGNLGVQGQFLGDGGFTVLLSSFGILGLLGYFIAFGSIVKFALMNIKVNTKIAQIIRHGLVSLVLAFTVGNLATGGLQERTIELFPVMVVVLAYIGIYEQHTISISKPTELEH